MGNEIGNETTNSKIKLRRNVKDSVFKSIFSEPRYLFELYRTLHPEDTTSTINDIKSVTLETVMAVGIYNDLGFIVGDKLLILAESQSTWSVNIILRSIMYLANTYQDYLDDTNQNIYSTKPVHIPEPELYVIYTGSKNINKTEISFSEEFFDGDQTAIDVRVKVIAEDDGTDVLNQYIIFCKVVDEQSRLKGRTKEALLEAIRICKDRNILREFLAKHEKEAVNIMMDLYDQDKITERLLRSERAEAEAEGEARGRAKGRAEGEARGRAELAKSTALTLHEMGIAVDQIAQAVKVSVAQVNEWLAAQPA